MADRAELADLLGILQAAMTRTAELPAVHRGLRYTENGQELGPGTGLWATADRWGTYRHAFFDDGTGQAGCFATVHEGQTHSVVFMRMKAAGGAITEVEMIAARPGLGGGGPFAEGAASLDAAGAPAALWDAVTEPGAQEGRAALMQAADRYFSGLERNDGRGDYNFTADCVRVENGFRTTNVPPASGAAGDTPYADAFRALGAREQFETGFFRFVDSIRDRRFPIVDTARGLVVALAFFDHAGTLREYELADGTNVSGAIDRPFTWMIAEAFRVEHGQLRLIEALMTAVPYGMGSGWPEMAA